MAKKEAGSIIHSQISLNTQKSYPNTLGWINQKGIRHTSLKRSWHEKE